VNGPPSPPQTAEAPAVPKGKRARCLHSDIAARTTPTLLNPVAPDCSSAQHPSPATQEEGTLPRGARVRTLDATLHSSPNTNDAEGLWAPIGPLQWVKLHAGESLPRHSCAPNSAVVMRQGDLIIEAIRPIPQGEAVTCDHTVAGLMNHWHPRGPCRGVAGCSLCLGAAPVAPWHTQGVDVMARHFREDDNPRQESKGVPALSLAQRARGRQAGCPPPAASCAGSVVDPRPESAGQAGPLDTTCLPPPRDPTSGADQKAACLKGDVMAAWLHIWARRIGAGFGSTMPAEDSDIWIAPPDLYSNITRGGQYCAWIARTTALRSAKIASTIGGRTRLGKVIIPIYCDPPVPHGTGHWIVAELDLREKHHCIFDWISNSNYCMARCRPRHVHVSSCRA